MKPSVLDNIIRFRETVGEGPAGKFLQRILALTLVRAGYNVEEEHTVEGPDLIVGNYQIEVKTTTTEPFTLAAKDIHDIEVAIERGKIPALAFLECTSFRGWAVGNAKGLTEGTYRRRDLALRCIPDLETAANKNFDAVVEIWMPLLSEDADTAFSRMDERRQVGQWQP